MRLNRRIVIPLSWPRRDITVATVELFVRLAQGSPMSAGWIPNSMASVLHRRIVALEGFVLERFRREENPDDCGELLTALTELRSLREILRDLFDSVTETDAAQ